MRDGVSITACRSTKSEIVGIALGCVLLASTALPAYASDWQVKAQANGSATNSGYGYCGSSDGSVNCASTTNTAAGSVVYANGNATITAQGQAFDGTSGAIAGGHVTADLTSATIRQANNSMLGSSGTAGTLADRLTFTLADPNTVYLLPFSYSFDGELSGDTVGNYHPSLDAYSYFGLGAASVASSQNIGLSGTAYYPPVVGVTNSGQWTNVSLTQSMYGYSLTGDVLIGGSWGNVLAFNMQSQIACGNEYGAASCDYGHTQAFDFGTLPSGTSYTSASGYFLTAVSAPALPETSAWVMMIIGCGAIGANLRSRRGANTRFAS